MASPTQWTWVWVNSRSWWWTGRPGVLQSMGSQRVGHDWATELTDWVWYVNPNLPVHSILLFPPLPTCLSSIYLWSLTSQCWLPAHQQLWCPFKLVGRIYQRIRGPLIIPCHDLISRNKVLVPATHFSEMQEENDG